MKKPRNRKRPPLSLQERLTDLAHQARSAAKSLPAGAQRDELLRKARHSEAAARIEGWLSSPSLQRPK